MEKAEQLKRVREFRDSLKEYMTVCQPFWEARNHYGRVDESDREKEATMREALTEEWGRLEQLFLKIKAPTHMLRPMAGVTRSIFDEIGRASCRERV